MLSKRTMPYFICVLHNVLLIMSEKSQSVSGSFVSDSAIPWTVALQVPLSMEFSRQEYWSG